MMADESQTAHQAVLAWLEQCHKENMQTSATVCCSLEGIMMPPVEDCSDLSHVSATTAWDINRPLPSFIWPSHPDEWTLDEPLDCSYFPGDEAETGSEDEEDDYEDQRERKKMQIMMQTPAPEDLERKERIFMRRPEPTDIVLNVAQWSLDHHVLTLSLLRKGPVHARHVEMLDRYFRLMYSLPDPQERPRHVVGSPSEVAHDGCMVHRGNDDHDPRYHPALVALSTLAKAEAWQKLTKDSDRILEIWADALSWSVGVLNSKPGLTAALCCLPRLLVRYSRCAEYDAVIRSAEEIVPMPHAGMFDPAYNHYHLLVEECSANVKRIWNTNEQSDDATRYRAAAGEIRVTREHGRLMHLEVGYLCDFSMDTRGPRAEGWTPEVAAMDEVRKLSARLKRYPLGGFVDAAISIPIYDLLDGMQGNIDPEAAQAFAQDISCLVTPPSEQAAIPSADRGVILHLPVLLVNNQIHECDLDDSSRNKQRLNCVSAVQFLATLGIKDFPVYGLATSGQYGYVSSTWYSSTDSCTYIADCNTAEHRFDLCEDGMVRFVDFLWGLRQHAEELKTRFDSIRGELVERMRTEEGRASLRWTLSCQLDEPDLWPDT